MIQVIVIADDFTGACDTALQFVKSGLRAGVWKSLPEPSGDAGDISVLVIDAETRVEPAQTAAERIADLCRQARRAGPRLIYKKIDSTLRGNVGPELWAALAALGSPLCLFAPAFPAEGRITVGGYHLVGGIPLSRSEVGHDPASPVHRSFLPDLLSDLGPSALGLVSFETVASGVEAVARAIDRLQSEGRSVLVFDAASDDDLRVIADAAAQRIDDPMRLTPPPLLCGSAGLAGHLPEAFGLRGAAPIPQPKPGAGPALVVAGSPASATRAQIAHLCDRLRAHLHAEPFKALQKGDEAFAEKVAAALLPHFGGDGDAVVLTVDAVPGAVSRAGGEAVLSALGRIVHKILSQTPVSGLVLTGGWTAVHIVGELGAWGAEVCAEVETGVPLCRLNGGPFDGLGVVTKAGGFGDAEALMRGVKCLKGLEDQGPHPPPDPLPLPYVREREGATRALSPALGEGEGLPLLAITMGDICGIGPEVIAKALAREEVYRRCRPLVIGHRPALKAALRFASRPLSIRPVASPSEGRFLPGTIDLLDPGGVDLSDAQIGQVCPSAGRAAVACVFRAADLALSGEVDGVVTAPLNKEAMNLAGFPYAGHTELLAERTGAATSRMMLATETFRIVHVTTHIALRDVPQRVTVDRILKTLDLAHEALLDLGIERPKIVVAGINPHCGEGGMFGDEDMRTVAPAVQQARERGWDVIGPLSPDTVFGRAYRGEFDAVIAMYHDQGHVPMKLVAFAEAVNVTLGLPIVRTSVDHGTAFDIAGRGIADETNMLAAIRLAARLANSRKARRGP